MLLLTFSSQIPQLLACEKLTMCVVAICVENSLQILSGKPSRVEAVPNSEQSKTKLNSTRLKFFHVVAPEKYQNRCCCML